MNYPLGLRQLAKAKRLLCRWRAGTGSPYLAPARRAVASPGIEMVFTAEVTTACSALFGALVAA